MPGGTNQFVTGDDATALPLQSPFVRQNNSFCIRHTLTGV
jgi:hypothetical protein